jgi:hypothetical protein
MNEKENETLEEERVIQSTSQKKKRESKDKERMKHPKKELLQLLNSERNLRKKERG